MDPESTPITAKSASPAYRAAPHWAAVLAAILTWPLVFAGGLVTTYRVGMAVPDWPTTFGENIFTYDLAEAAFGVRVEHIHRLAGAAVGLCTIALMLDFLAFDRRRSVKALGVLALIAVIAQGVLGGMRVRNNSTTLAMIHGCTGQAFFAFMVGLAAITARSWFAPRRPVEGEGRVKVLAAATLLIAYFQITLGAWLRHYPAPAPLMSHAGSALLVVGVVAATIVAVRRRNADVPGLLGPLRAIEMTLGLQLVLGIAAWWMLRPFDGIARGVSTAQALIRTGHQANAALLLGAAVVLVIRVYGRAAGVPEARPTAEPATTQWPAGLGVAAS
ncbi:MAG TPA: COX15/CtaA family protein [Isosphaeraceae bacterium]